MLSELAASATVDDTMMLATMTLSADRTLTVDDRPVRCEAEKQAPQARDSR